jgi:aspartyl-tRNA(Asn)/glutamyl-tRNA(Gln) amidotransferase subunit C
LPLSREEVLHVAQLARVRLSDADVARFQEQLSQILDHFDLLNRIDTTDVQPTTHAFAAEQATQADEVRPSLPVEEVLRNAPLEQDGHLRVRAVLEE